MGLASSQARLLTLTARQHSVEYAAQRIEAQKLQLANESDQVYNRYLERLDASKIQYRRVESDGSIAYDDATFNKLYNNYYLFNVDGVICKSFQEVKDALKEKRDIDITADDYYTVLSALIQEGLVVLMEIKGDPESGYEYDKDNAKITFTPPESDTPTSTWDVNSDNEEYVYKVFENTSISTSTKVSEMSDEKELKKAEAQYEADMNRINAKDARYDTQLSQLETERNAIKNEIDTLKTVANDNVERTFKIFS